jgi:CheY-like chemotaxis protein
MSPHSCCVKPLFTPSTLTSVFCKGNSCVIYTDPGQAKRLARHLERVLVVDPQPASTRLITELLKDLGARFVMIESSNSRAMAVARAEDPQIIFCEYSGVDVDGLELTRQLRRSELRCRQAPVVMVTSEATAQAILGARDAGVHEFLRKPYTIKDLVRRLEAVTLKQRDWVEAVRYIGPDRRRFNSGDYKGPRKRKSDTKAMPEASRIEQALRILKSAVGAIESDPRQALRAMQAQVIDLTKGAVAIGDNRLAAAAASLQYCLTECQQSGHMNRPKIEQACLGLWPYLPADSERAA